MPDWSSPEELEKDAAALGKVMLVMFGIFIWEYLTSLNYEWDVLSGKRKFRWPMIPYFACRYSIFCALIGLLIVDNNTSEIDCQALYTVIQATGNIAIGCASVNLSLRTIAVWSRRIYIVIPIIIISLGQWSLLLYSIKIYGYWDPTEQACIIQNVPPNIEAAIFLYSMAFDLTIMCLTGFKLGFQMKTGKRSKLVQLIFFDGMIYFFVVFATNLVASVLAVLNLNSVMSVIAGAPSAVIASIAACRIVRRLSTYNDPDNLGGLSLPTATASAFNFKKKSSWSTKASRVHVHMDTFAESHIASQSFIDLDASGHTKSVITDPQEQAVMDDFKKPPY